MRDVTVVEDVPAQIRLKIVVVNDAESHQLLGKVILFRLFRCPSQCKDKNLSLHYNPWPSVRPDGAGNDNLRPEVSRWDLVVKNV